MKRMIVRLTRSEQIAVLNVLIEHWQGCENVTENFVDPLTDPPTTVSYGDLLVKFVRMGECEDENPPKNDSI